MPFDYTIYEQIVRLRSEANNTLRGYRFEQLLREINPWSHRPPVVQSTSHEQIDAFFEWNGWFFLLEAKAKSDPILRGSHDWEDFELKIRRRRGASVGIFCSLGPVHDKVLEAATELSQEGIATIVFHGHFWESIMREPIPFSEVLRYMVSRARSVNLVSPPDVSEIRHWIYDREAVLHTLHNRCRSKSATFLRRNKLPRHSDIYVERQIDTKIRGFIKELKPSRLASLRKQRNKDGTEFETIRQLPEQMCIIRDASGAGKTTLAVDLVFNPTEFFAIGKAALEPDIDVAIDHILSENGEDYGIHELMAVDRPILVVIDSLDEAIGYPNKHRELLALFRLVNELNMLAQSAQILCFPIGIVLTIREEYWRDWESILEGQRSRVFKNTFTEFSAPELDKAIGKYSIAYNYFPLSKPGTEARRVLSIPFNLLVFSEANEFEGDVALGDILEEDVLHLYFTRKQEDILKRRLPGMHGSQLLRVASRIALTSIEKRQNLMSREELLDSIIDALPHSKDEASQISISLVSERLLVLDTAESTAYRFRHMRFIEYLLAWYMAEQTHLHASTLFLDEITAKIFASGIVSMYHVHDFLRHICAREFREIRKYISDYYGSSELFMVKAIRHIRDSLASGQIAEQHDIDLMLQKSHSASPEVAWGSFFVVAAKNNDQPEEAVLYAFEVAWKANNGSSERWRLIDRLASRRLTVRRCVLERILASEAAKEWEVYLGFVAQCDRTTRDRFVDLWSETASDTLIQVLAARDDIEWRVTKRLLSTILSGDPYILGLE
jgi:hypothetical protein